MHNWNWGGTSFARQRLSIQKSGSVDLPHFTKINKKHLLSITNLSDYADFIYTFRAYQDAATPRPGVKIMLIVNQSLSIGRFPLLAHKRFN